MSLLLTFFTECDTVFRNLLRRFTYSGIKMLVTEDREQRALNEFGRTLNKVMVNHDVFQWKQLRLRLEDVGYRVGQSRLSQYVNGKRNPEDPQELFDALARALDLDESEKMRLAYSFAYPIRPSAENLKVADEVEQEAAEDEEGDDAPEGQAS